MLLILLLLIFLCMLLTPPKDFTRSSKLSIDKLLPFLVSRGSSCSKLELLDFFGFYLDSPSASALVQQQAKLRPDALKALFHHFHSSVSSEETSSGYSFLAVDGSTFTYFSKPSFSLRLGNAVLTSPYRSGRYCLLCQQTHRPYPTS